MRTILKIACAAALLAAAGCGEERGSGAGVRVVATTPQAADMTRAVAGHRAQVSQILRAGLDAHDFEPRPSDARALAEGDVVVSSGGGLDDWVDELASTAGFDGRRLTLFDEVGPRGVEDPHWWQDPRNAVRAVGEIEAALTAADPAGRAAYARSARAYEERLRRLDRSIEACVARVPSNRRKLVTTHDAFGLYARRYDIEVVGALIPSLSTQAQPSGRDIARLVNQIKAERVEAIFPETKLNLRLERAVSREAGVRVAPGLWADTLGPPGSPAGTYIGSLAVNTGRLVEGMSGGRVRCRPRA